MGEVIRQVPEWLDVTPETLAKLNALLDLVTKWTPEINLVSSGSLNQAWDRHILDSAQLWAHHAIQSGLWLDIGSGGGFPGLVVAILAEQHGATLRVKLVESDRRKVVFLKQAARTLRLNVDVECVRAELMAPAHADVVSARAVASLAELLPLAARHLGDRGFGLFLKGQRFQSELEDALLHWHMRTEVIASKTEQGAATIKVWDLRVA